MRSESHAPLDLNAAHPSEIQDTLGVDRLLARRIVMDRKLYGRFERPEDLSRVQGAGQLLVDAGIEVESGEIGGLTLCQIATVSSEDHPIVFWGPPDFVRGSIEVRNESRAMLSGVSIRVEETDIRTKDGVPLRWLQAQVPLLPEEQRKIHFRIPIDPHTPAGIHTAELVAGRSRERVAIAVSERSRIGVTPALLSLPNAPDAAVDRDVIVHNSGNLPVTLDRVSPVMLEDRDLLPRLAREVSRKSTHPTWDQVVGSISDEVKRADAHGALKVRVKDGPIALEPGETAIVQLEFSIPTHLHKDRRYIGRVSLHNARLIVDIH